METTKHISIKQLSKHIVKVKPQKKHILKTQTVKAVGVGCAPLEEV